LPFKAERLPVLWLGADRWPNVQWRLTHLWCLAFYLMLTALIVMRLRRRQYVPELLYLYLALIFCASPLIHFEFRYTFPIWNTLVLVPGLLVATLTRERLGRGGKSFNPEPSATAPSEPSPKRLSSHSHVAVGSASAVAAGSTLNGAGVSLTHRR
jgi:hypothetical protein